DEAGVIIATQNMATSSASLLRLTGLPSYNSLTFLGSGSYSGAKRTPLCSRVCHLMESSSGLGAFHHAYSSSASLSSLGLAFFPSFAGGAGLPFLAGVTVFDFAFLEMGASESDSSFLTPFDFLFAGAPLD